MQLLKDCNFPDKEWMRLGLKLGLAKNTLDNIETNHPSNVSRCLMECLFEWLKKADKVVSRTHEALIIAACSVEKIDQESELTLINITI